MIQKSITLFCLVLLCACSPKIKSNLTTHFEALPATDTILWINADTEVPKGSILVGDIKIGDSGFTTKCSYEETVTQAIEEARASGATILQFTEVKKPTLLSTCYRLKAKLYRNTDASALAALQETIAKKNASRLPEGTNYAQIHFYRTKTAFGAAVGFDIKTANDSVIGRMKNGKKFTYTTSQEGKHTFYASTEKTDSIVIPIRKGQEYFVKCEVREGVAIGVPKIYVVENRVGIQQYNALK